MRADNFSNHRCYTRTLQPCVAVFDTIALTSIIPFLRLHRPCPRCVALRQVEVSDQFSLDVVFSLSPFQGPRLFRFVCSVDTCWVCQQNFIIDHIVRDARVALSKIGGRAHNLHWQPSQRLQSQSHLQLGPTRLFPAGACFGRSRRRFPINFNQENQMTSQSDVRIAPMTSIISQRDALIVMGLDKMSSCCVSDLIRGQNHV